MDEYVDPDRTRREGVESTSIRLADGNLWGLALPRARLRPQVVRGVDSLGRSTEMIEVVAEFGYPIEIRRLMEKLRDACERAGPESQHEALFRLAASLLRRAHDLEIDEVARLLEIDLEALPGFVDAVLSVVTGACPDPPESP